MGASSAIGEPPCSAVPFARHATPSSSRIRASRRSLASTLSVASAVLSIDAVPPRHATPMGGRLRGVANLQYRGCTSFTFCNYRVAGKRRREHDHDPSSADPIRASARRAVRRGLRDGLRRDARRRDDRPDRRRPRRVGARRRRPRHGERARARARRPAPDVPDHAVRPPARADRRDGGVRRCEPPAGAGRRLPALRRRPRRHRRGAGAVHRGRDGDGHLDRAARAHRPRDGRDHLGIRHVERVGAPAGHAARPGRRMARLVRGRRRGRRRRAGARDRRAAVGADAPATAAPWARRGTRSRPG